MENNVISMVEYKKRKREERFADALNELRGTCWCHDPSIDNLYVDKFPPVTEEDKEEISNLLDKVGSSYCYPRSFFEEK